MMAATCKTLQNKKDLESSIVFTCTCIKIYLCQINLFYRHYHIYQSTKLFIICMPLDFYCYPLSGRVPIQGVITSLIDITLRSINNCTRRCRNTFLESQFMDDRQLVVRF